MRGVGEGGGEEEKKKKDDCTVQHMVLGQGAQ